ncbi:MAG: DUF692 domain-containing protein [Betaproteobacteria bacterium]|nr:DUF692 domain-containing protein [Betaproteobacteria bacterium]
MKPAPAFLPCSAGIGLRAPHTRELLAHPPNVDWVEVHSENFFAGGMPLATLRRVRERHDVSLHGVGMGLASPGALDPDHLTALRRLCDAVEPAAVSEHLSWNRMHGTVFNDLLPFPYTRDALRHVTAKVQQVQETLGRPLLVENLSAYLTFENSEMSEGEFLAELARRTGCGLLVDLQNLHVNAVNHGTDALAHLEALPAGHVMEYHLAGASPQEGVLVDTHDAPVSEATWALYEAALERIGPRPTLIEWDQDLPELQVLLAEAQKAQQRLEACHAALC